MSLKDIVLSAMLMVAPAVAHSEVAVTYDKNILDTQGSGVTVGFQHENYLTQIRVSEEERNSSVSRLALSLDANYMAILTNGQPALRNVTAQFGGGVGYRIWADIESIDLDFFGVFTIPQADDHGEPYLNLQGQVNMGPMLLSTGCQLGLELQTCSLGIGVRY
jgi:hypothetical protein